MSYYNKYLKFQIPYQTINSILTKQNKSKIIFFIDLQSIAKGFYNKDNIFWEINHYMENKQPSDRLLDELKSFLNNLYRRYKQYNPFFVIFYDDGQNSQNTAINGNYKGGRSSVKHFLYDNEEHELYKQIKSRYFVEVEKQFMKPGIGQVYYLRKYESDMIPFYIISSKLFESGNMSTLNVVLSNDKDLLQTCQFKNTIQITNTFSPSKQYNRKLLIEAWDNKNAITYLCRTFIPGMLFAKHVPLLLAMAGDHADNIHGISGVGFKKAISYIQNFDLPTNPQELKMCDKLPTPVRDNLDVVINNLKLTCFKEQLRRCKHKLFQEEFYGN